MTTVPPPINPNLPQMLAAATARQASTGQPTAIIAAPPPVLAALPPGSTLQGTVTTTPDPRVVLLATPAGDVRLQTPTPLPDGASVTLEVVRATPAQISVKLVTIDGAPVAPQSAPPPPPTAEEPPAQTQPAPLPLPSAPGTPLPIAPGYAWWPGGAQPVTALPILSAVVITAPPGLIGVPSPQGAPVTIPGATPGTTPSAVPAPTPTSAAPPGTSTTPLPNVPSLPLVAGADIALRVVSIALPTAPANPGAVPPQGAGPQLAIPSPVPNVPTQSGPTPSGPEPNGTAPPPTVLPPSVAATATSAQPPSQPAIGLADLTDAATRVADQDTTPGLVLPKGGVWPTAAATPPVTVQTAPPLAQLTGTVIAIKDGVAVLRLADAEVQLNARANLPVGTTITVEVRAIQPPLTPLPLTPLPPPALMPLSLAQPSWPTLTESLALLTRADPAAAQQLANVLPDGGPRTALAVISFVQAMRSGESRQWPGDATLRALERVSPRGAHLASQLGAEIEDMSRPVRDATGDWRGLALPWQTDGRVDRIRMVFREIDPDADADAEKRKGGGGLRFLLDLDLSRLGPLQLDGIFRQGSRQLDLMIRTKSALPDTVRQDLSGIFTQSNAAMGLAGGLTFQVTPKFADPLARSTPGDKSGLWV